MDIISRTNRMFGNKNYPIYCYWLTYFSGLLWVLYLFTNSRGVYTHDEIAHFIISRNAWNYPELMLDLWGRSFNTIIYMIPSLGGLTAARYMSLILACLTVLMATKVAQRLDVKQLFLIPLFLWFQPWFNSQSFTAITEVPFSFLGILAVYLWLSGKLTRAGLALGLLPLIRHEGVIILAAWGIFQLTQKNWPAVISAAIPLVIYNLVYHWVFGHWAFEIYLEPQPLEVDRHGSWFHFFPRVAIKVGLPVLILSLSAIVPIWKLKERGYFFYGYLLYFLSHVAIFRFGLYSSGGYSYFLLPLAPAFAIAAAIGAEYILNSPATYFKRILSKQAGGQRRVLMISMAIILVVGLGLLSRPYPLDYQAVALREAAHWIQAKNISNHKIVSTHVWFYYFYNLHWKPHEWWYDPPKLEELPPGTFVVWDQKYSNKWGVMSETLSNPANGWKKLKEFGKGFAIVYQKTNN